MPIPGARKRIEEAILVWPGLESTPHIYGGREYRLGSREIGHIHDDGLVDIPFPKKVRDELVSFGRAEPHHILPESGWISLFLRADEDVGRAVELLKLSYEIAARQKLSRTTGEE